MAVINYITFINNHIRYPKLLFLIIPIMIILFFLIRYDFARAPFETVEIRSLKRFSRVFVFFTRSLIFLLLLIALASPFNIEEKIFNRDPFIKILVDNTTSFDLFDKSISTKLKSQLEEAIGVEVRELASGEKSDIADGILRNLKNEDSILLITDGNNNHGSELGDVVLFAKKLNASINALDMKLISSDIAVYIEGPSQTMVDVDNTFTVKVNSVGDITEYNLKVTVNGNVILDKKMSELEYSFTQKFKNGFHEITAEVTADNDYFPVNNIFYKTVKVVPKPKILFYSDRSFPLYGFLLDLYDVQKSSSIPDDLSDYYAVIVNNMKASQIDKMDTLIDFLTDGNGLIVVGGDNSYDLSDYKDSVFESILPVFVAQPGKKKGDVNIIILMDVSGSFVQQGSISKSITTSIFRDIGSAVRIGAIAFAENSYLISDLKPKLENLDLEQKIARLDVKGDAGTNIAGALYNAINLLSRTSGSKNIILLTDGDPTSSAGGTINAAVALAAQQGMKVYPVGIGTDIAEGRLRLWADMTGGIYFKVDQAKRFKILFGDLEDQKDISTKAVTILDSNHFITENLVIDAFMTGYNQVVPKTIAKLLVTTNTGDPVISVWHYGLGRVASLSTDDGTLWAGDILKVKNSKLLTRTMNWAIGTPDRKSKDFVNVKDTRINVPTELSLRTETQPVAEGVVFYKADKDLYKAEITPTEIGFNKILGATYASNYPLEYQNIGLNQQLSAIVQDTNGKLFKPDDIVPIIEQVKSNSQKIISAKVDKRWPFLIAAIVLFLIEITIRRIVEHKKIYKSS